MSQQRSWAWVVVVCLFGALNLGAQQSGSGNDSSAGAAVDSTPRRGWPRLLARFRTSSSSAA